MTTTNNDSEQNLEHLEALAREVDAFPDTLQPFVSTGGQVVIHTFSMSVEQANKVASLYDALTPAAVLELIALARRAAPAGLSTALAEVTEKLGRVSADNLSLNMSNIDLRDQLARRAAPVSAPIAGDELPVGVCWSEQRCNFYRADSGAGMGAAFYDQWRDRADEFPDRTTARAALANQPAPTAAPAIPTGEQLYTMVTSRFKSGSFPWAMVADSGKAAWSAAAADLIFSPDTIAARLSQPSEAAPLRIEIQDGGSGSWPIGVHDADGDLIARFSYKRDAERFAHQPAQEQADDLPPLTMSAYGTRTVLELEKQRRADVEARASQAAQHEVGDELRNIGNQMANVMFNLAQRPGDALTSDIVATMDKLRKEWDAARAASPVVRAQSEESGVPQEWRQVLDEVARATRKFPTWPTDPLHAIAVLGEEFGELTKAVLQTAYEPHKVEEGELRTEAIQTAAMALRFVASLDRYEFTCCAQHSQGRAAIRAAQEGGAA